MKYDKDVVKFAKALHQELKRAGWGDLDPWLIELIAGKTPMSECSDDTQEDVKSLHAASAAALKKLRE